MDSRSMILASPGTSPILRSRSSAGTSSPDSTLPPSVNFVSRPLMSALPSEARKVSAIARRSRWSSTSCSLPSSLTSNSTLPRSVLTTAGRSQTLATGCCSPVIAARRTADAATASAAAIANRAGLLAVPGDLRLLADQFELGLQGHRVVGTDLGAEPVLERGDDPAAVGVVLRVRAGHQDQVERQPQRVTADADVALLKNVEQGHLDPLGQVGKLVQAEHAPVRPRQQAEVDRLGVAQRPALRDLDRVDVADQVAHAGVRGRKLLDVPVVPVLPGDRQVVALLGGQPAAPGADRSVRVVVDLAAFDCGRPLVEQAGERPDQAGLALAALPEQDHVVPGDDGPLQVRQDGLAEADDPGEGILTGAQPG